MVVEEDGEVRDGVIRIGGLDISFFKSWSACPVNDVVRRRSPFSVNLRESGG